LEEFSILIQIKSVQKVTHRKREQTVGDVASGREVNMKTKQGVILSSELSKYMILRRITTKEDLRRHTTIGSNCTMLKYLNDPDRMPIGNMKQIMFALKIPKDEQMKILEKLWES